MSVINALPYGGGSSEKYKHKVEITKSGTWTVPTGVTQIAVRLFGGGGGGMCYYKYNSSSSNAEVLAGGGGGCMAYKELSVTPGIVYAITIGSGGTCSPSISSDRDIINSNPTDGGTTSFGDLLTALGGSAMANPNGGLLSSYRAGSGGTGGGCSCLTGKTASGGTATYGGGGGSSYVATAQLNGGKYGGNGGTVYTALVSEASIGIDSMPGSGYAAGGGGYKADGGNADDADLSYRSSCAGGGGGWEGGKGGSGRYFEFVSEQQVVKHCAGGGGGYGSKALTDVECGGGYGYGAGGGGGIYISSIDGSYSISTATITMNCAGAQGICIIYY